MIYSFDNKEIKSFDTVVIGNSISAVHTAIRSAKEGLLTAIVFPSELLCSELSVNMCLNVCNTSFVAEFFNELGIEISGFLPFVSISQGTAVKSVLKRLRELGVCILPKMTPAGYRYVNGKRCGVLVASKFGCHLLNGNKIIDADIYRKNTDEYIYAIKVTGAENLDIPIIYEHCSERILSVCVSRDNVHKSGAVISYKFRTDEIATPNLLIETVAEVINFIKKKNGFENLNIVKTALEPLAVGENSDPYPAIDNEYCECILKSEKNPDSILGNYSGYTINGIRCNVEYTGKYLDDFLGVSMPEVCIPTDVMKKSRTGLIIAGLGTGGMAALKGALDSGCTDITAIECLPLPGGTNALGMVEGYWHGYCGGHAADNMNDIKQYADENFGDVKYELYMGPLLYYSHLLGSDGVSLRMSSVVFGTVTENNRVKGIMVAGSYGAEYIESDLIIDTTGDGDVAVMAGCEYRANGDIRDGVTQGYSIWGDIPGGVGFNDTWVRGDDDSISTEYYSEFLRGLLLTQSRNSEHGFSPLLTVRESRSVTGKYVVNLTDAVNNVNFDDTLTASTCVYDAHGVGTGLAYYTDLFASIKPLTDNPDFMIRIPLRALMPQNTDGILVASKAISATRDAGCMIRMNADIKNIGYAAGYVGGKAVLTEKSVEIAFDSEAKAYFCEKGMYPEECDNLYIPSAEELADGIAKGERKAVTSASLRKDVVPVLENRYREMENNEKYYAGIVLAALGSTTPFEDLLAELDALCINSELITRSNVKVSTLCILLSLLAKDEENLKNKFIDVMIKVIDSAEAGGEPVNRQNVYQNSKVSNRVVPNFRMLMALALTVEISADKRLAKPVEILMGKKFVAVDEKSEIHSVQLWMRLAAACARCGGVYGARMLLSLIDNERVFFRKFAIKELRELYGIDFECSKEQWYFYVSEKLLRVTPLKNIPELWY